MIIHTDASELLNKETGNVICAVHSVVVYDDNYRFIKKVTDKTFSRNITQAEGTSILMAIELAENGSIIKSDSQNIVEGSSEVSELIKLLCEEKDITLKWIPREENTHADLLCHQERNEIINLYIKADLDVVNKPRNTKKIDELENILKVGEEVKQPGKKKAKGKVKKNVKTSKKENVSKNVIITDVINPSIFNLLECSDNNEKTISKTKKRNEMVKLFKATHQKVLEKVENDGVLNPEDMQCLAGLEYLSKNKKHKLDVIREVCYPKYIERSNGIEVIMECDFIGLAKKHMKYVVGTQKSFNTLVNEVIYEIANNKSQNTINQECC